MQINVNIDDNELTEAITKGIKNLSEDTINDLAKQAICEFLQNKECLEGILFETNRNYGYPGYSVDYTRPRSWFVNLAQNSFDDSEVKKYREILYNQISENGTRVVISTLAKVLSGMMFSTDAQNQFAYALMRLDRLEQEKNKE